MDAGQRIAAAIHQTEDAIQPLAQEPDRYLESQPLRWMVLTEDLAAATTGSITTPSFAAANPANWQAAANGGTGGYVVDTAVTYTVAETTGLADYHAGDWLLCRPLGTKGGFVWEPIPGGCCLNHPTSGSGGSVACTPPAGATCTYVELEGTPGCWIKVWCTGSGGSGGSPSAAAHRAAAEAAADRANPADRSPLLRTASVSGSLPAYTRARSCTTSMAARAGRRPGKLATAPTTNSTISAIQTVASRRRPRTTPPSCRRSGDRILQFQGDLGGDDCFVFTLPARPTPRPALRGHPAHRYLFHLLMISLNLALRYGRLVSTNGQAALAAAVAGRR